ncbi:hypothetical protein NDN08_006181 [Rhodosorus marinus]|uniref:Phosphate transporter n=1 Tax=Rhodosorus marinus TaxID=101924 RepID=A0AAV8UQJ8_9RHOD|nr:hypothetical protein NDN08_006181 [Rhodosorus marinus]
MSFQELPFGPITIDPVVSSYVLLPFTWILAVSLVVTFWQGGSMGANDVSNSFGTSVGSRVLTVNMACILAAIFITLGALALGGQVAKTVGKGIVNYDAFKPIPGLYMLGMMTSSMATGLWVSIATVLSLPVSTTHSIVGATIGFGLVQLGANGIDWWPGVGKIVISWIASPLLSGVFSSVFYVIAKYWIVKPFRDTHNYDPEWRPIALRRQKIYVCVVWFLVTFTVVMFICTTVRDDWYGPAAGIAIGAAVGVALVGYFFLIDFTNRRLDNMELRGGFIEDEKEQLIDEILRNEEDDAFDLVKNNDSGMATTDGANIIDAGVKNFDDEDAEAQPHDAGKFSSMPVDEVYLSRNGSTITIARLKEERKPNMLQKVGGWITKYLGGGGNKKDVSMYAPDDIWDLQLEKRFAGGQVMSACYEAFAAGANDISNAAGTLMAVYQTLQTGNLVDKPDPVYWALAYSCVGIIFGLYFFGTRVMHTIGENLTVLTPLRGLCAELATAFTVLIASYIGIPVSTTHCSIGAVLAVGFFEPDGFKKANYGLVGKIILSWIVTLPIAGGVSALIYVICQGAVTAALGFYPNVLPGEEQLPFAMTCDPVFLESATCSYSESTST